MGDSDRDSDALGDGRTGASSSGRARSRRPRAARALRRSILALCLLVVGLLLPGTPALASFEAGHAFGKSFTGSGKCDFSAGEPTGVAVNEATGEGAGDVYVYDRATNAVDVFSSTGTCLLHRKVGAAETGEEGNEGIAVDNSGGPSAGDVYVVEGAEKAIVKFRPAEGGKKLVLVRKIKKFALKEGNTTIEEFPEFETIHGIGVDSEGSLWVDEGETFIDHFSGNEPNVLAAPRVELTGECNLPRPGFAVGPNEVFYAARERENHKGECEEATVLTKLNSAGEPFTELTRNSQLDSENTTGVAVDRETGAVYFDNGTNVSAFNASGNFLQRFGDEGSGHLHAGTGVAVNSKTNDVYVVDAQNGEVEVYGPAAEQPGREGGPTLPDGRAWEMVSPQNKFSASIYPITLFGGMVQSSEDGSEITYTANAPIVPTPATNRSPEPATVLSRRGSTSWGTEGISTPRSQVPSGFASSSGPEYEFFTSNLASAFLNPDLHGLTTTKEPPLSPEATEGTPYTRDLTKLSSECEPTPSPCYQALVSPPAEEFGDKATFTSATPDGRYAVLKSTVALTSEPITGQGLYEWAGHGAPLQLVSVFPAGEEATSELRLGGLGEQNGGVMRNAISSQGPDEGRRVIWTGLEGEESRLYLRDTSTHETVRLDKAQGVPQPEESKAVFDTASADGKKIFFTDPQPLTPDSTVGEVEEEGEGDLYLCEVVEEGGKSACKLKDLTAEVTTPAENAAVQGVLGASDDGSYVYFVANGVLATDAGRGQCEVREPAELQQETEGLLPVESCNLYVRHFNGTVWEPPKFLAALTTQDEHDWHAIVKGQGSLAAMTTRVSPNGLYLSFMSNRSLTGYNNVDAKEENVQDEEVFLFSYGSDQVICASCNPQRNEKSEAVRPHGVLDQVDSGEGLGLVIDRPENWKGRWLAANLPGWTARGKETAVYQPRYLSDSGRLFFNSVDGLVPADKNGKADVYEYEPAGEGTCTSSAGCISLISSGTSEQESAFLDASLGGSNAFFLTSAKLSTQDVDTGFDVYDARVCTGSSPCLTPSEERAQCTSEAGCRGSGSTAPALPGAPPTSLPSSGNAGKLVVLSNTARGKSKLTRAQLLARELKKCKKLKAKKKRHACERRARKKYGPVKKGKSSRRSHGRRR